MTSAPLLQVLRGQALAKPPIWLMRQAGRYLPEYRQLRAKAGGFLDLCYTPELAAEVSLQPIRRFGFDAAILFSDILVVPDALGQTVAFVEGHGPRLQPLAEGVGLAGLDRGKATGKFAAVFETVERVRTLLPDQTALIGFCGAPWTVATYMIAGAATPDQAPARLHAHRDPVGFQNLIDLLVDVSVDYLGGQIAAGADAVQIFDSWAGVLAEDQFERWVVAPTAALVAKLRARHPHVPVIGFPRGAGALYPHYANRTGVDGIGCDTAVPLALMKERLAPRAAVQGHLDPLLLVAGGEALERRVRDILATLAGIPHIFNLGHGIVPETPVDHVARLVQLVRS